MASEIDPLITAQRAANTLRGEVMAWQPLLDRLPKLTRRQKVKRWARNRDYRIRTAVATRIAPWLDDGWG